VFDGRNILDGLRDILISDGRIVEISVRPIAVSAEREIDVDRRFVMPGLIDAHFHATLDDMHVRASESAAPSYLAQRAAARLEAALLRGFTTVRDAGGADFGYVKATEEGLIDGPRLLVSGRPLSQTGGHGDSSTWNEPCSCGSQLFRVVDGAEAVRHAVRDELRRGANQIKIFVSGGIMSPTDPIWMNQFSDEEISAAVYEAATRRTYVLAHAYTAESIRRAVALGVRSIEHGNLIDLETAKFVAASGSYVDPTLSAYSIYGEANHGAPPHAVAKVAEVAAAGATAVATCRAAGVKLGFGTDLLGHNHVHQSREFRLRCAVDDPLDVLRSATSVNAELLGRQGEIGEISSGAYADVIVLDGDPTVEVGIFERPGALLLIMQGGRFIYSSLGFQQPKSV
jgi:imidazolonepropionase-like amidohydrolase